MPDFGISEAQLVALALEAAFWGIFIVFYASCMHALLVTLDGNYLRRTSAINWPMVVVATAMFFIGTLDVALGLYNNIRAFVQWKEEGGSDEEFTIISDWANVMKVCVYMRT